MKRKRIHIPWLDQRLGKRIGEHVGMEALEIIQSIDSSKVHQIEADQSPDEDPTIFPNYNILYNNRGLWIWHGDSASFALFKEAVRERNESQDRVREEAERLLGTELRSCGSFQWSVPSTSFDMIIWSDDRSTIKCGLKGWRPNGKFIVLTEEKSEFVKIAMNVFNMAEGETT